MPLITLPYLVRVLGPEKFGLLAFAQAFVAYFGILIDYGFNLSATREVSIHRDNKEKLNEIYSSVVTLKFIFMLISFLFMSLLIFSFKKFHEYYIIYYFIFIGFISNLLFQSWIFQGLEKMKIITFINIFTKLIFTFSIFVFIRESTDFIYVPLISSIGNIIGGIFSIIILIKFFKIKYTIPSLKSIIFYFKESTPLFFSQVSISFFNQINILIGGLLFNYTIVGYYSAAEKLFVVIRNIYNVIFNTLYPFFSRNINKFNITYIKFVLFVSLTISIISFCSSDFLIPLLFGTDFEISIKIFKIFSFILFFSGLNTLIFTLFILINNKYKMFFVITLIGGVINITFIFILFQFFQIFSIPYSIVIVEIAILFIYFYLVKNELLTQIKRGN